MERYTVNYSPAIKGDGRIKWYVHSTWKNEQDAKRAAAGLREHFRDSKGVTLCKVEIVKETVSAWATIRKAARRALEWFVNEGADALGEVVAGVGMLGLVLLLPIIAAVIG